MHNCSLVRIEIEGWGISFTHLNTSELLCCHWNQAAVTSLGNNCISFLIQNKHHLNPRLSELAAVVSNLAPASYGTSDPGKQDKIVKFLLSTINVEIFALQLDIYCEILYNNTGKNTKNYIQLKTIYLQAYMKLNASPINTLLSSWKGYGAKCKGKYASVIFRLGIWSVLPEWLKTEFWKVGWVLLFNILVVFWCTMLRIQIALREHLY